MGQVVIQRANGAAMPLYQIYPLCWPERAEQVKSLMGEDVVNLTVKSQAPLPFSLGDKLSVFGEVYKLNLLPTARKAGAFLEYDITLEGPQYDLLRAIYMNADATGFFTGNEFSLTGDLQLFLNVLQYNADRVFGAGVWLLENVPTTTVRTLSFSGENCLSVLQRVCKEFDQEFIITQSGGINTIHIGKAGRVLEHKFEYGHGNGLYSLTRTVQKDKNIVTRLFAYGGSRNLPSNYRNAATKLQINDLGFIQASDELIDKLGINEGTLDRDDIYPHRTGTVSALVLGDVNSFIDASLDFDLNEKVDDNTTYLIPGTNAKVKFNTGGLAGYEFEITKYDHAAKKFTLIPYKDPRGQVFPDAASTAFQIAAGDQYVLLDIYMPASYVTAAEGELNTAAQALLDQSTQGVPVQYTLGVDSFFLAESTEEGSLPNFFELGDLVPLLDTELEVDRSSRVIAFRRDLLKPFNYDVTIADSYEVKLIERLIADRAEVRTIVRLNNLKDPNTARLALRNQQELLGLVFDADGYFDPDRIKPLSIETTMLAVGSKSQQFQLRDIVIEPNYQGQKNVVRVTGGQLIHLSIADTIKTWNIKSETNTFADDGSYYIYARCAKAATTGSIVFSKTQYKVDDQATDWNFMIGVLHTVDVTLGIRQISLTYGATTVNGRTIKTGVIMSADGKTFFDLDNGVIGGKITFRGGDGELKDVKEQFEALGTLDFTALNADIDAQAAALAALGNTVATQGNSLGSIAGTVGTLQTVVDQVKAQVDGGLTDWFYEGAPTLNNLPASNWTTNSIKDEHIHDRYYDTLNFSGYRFIKTGSVYSWSPIVDQVALNALQLASQAKDTADGKRRVFVNQPAPPYDVGDLWADGVNLRRCTTARQTGAYNALDWDKATYYDNTVVEIDRGIITAGSLLLAGPGGSVRAGITGNGTAETSVRLFLGGSYENKHLANFRAMQNGVVQSKTRYELVDQNEVVVGGMSGRTSGQNTDIGFWMGGTGPTDQNSPTRINYAGKAFLKDAEIGGWRISGQGIVNDDGTAYLITRSNVSADNTEARIGANVFPATFFGKGAAVFNASEVDAFSSNYGAVFTAKNGLYNYAIYAPEGVSMLSEAKINGRAEISLGIADAITTRVFDPSRHDVINIFPDGSGGRFIKLLAHTSTALPIKTGTQVIIFNENKAKSDLFLIDTIRNISSFQIPGGHVVTLFFKSPYWYLSGSQPNTF